MDWCQCVLVFLSLKWKQLLTYAQEHKIVSFPPIIVADSTHGNFKIGSPLLLNLISQRVDLEPIKSWNKLIGGLLRSIFRMNHEQHVWETSSKICSVGVVMT